MAISKQHPANQDDLSALPLGLLLGRISGVFRMQLLDACENRCDDVRLIGLALAIEYNPGSTQADYARFLGIDLNTASRLINRAEELGLLSKSQSASDRRAFTLELTAAGKALAKSGSQATDGIEAALKEAVGETEYRSFREAAERMLCLLTFR